MTRKFSILQDIHNHPSLEPDISLFEGWKLGEELIMLESDEDIPEPMEGEYGSYIIGFNMFPYFQEGLDKVNKMANKLGVPPLTIESKTKIILKKDKKDQPVFGWKIMLKGEPVRLNGWEFLASLEHGAKGNNIRYVPGKEDPRVRQYANASNSCDFCHSARDRNNTYIIRNVDTGELKQVGGQCLQKYIGDNARKLAKFAFHMDEFMGGLNDDEESGSGERGRRGVETTDAQTALAAAIISIDKRGFVKSGGRDEWDDRVTTAQLVKCGVFGWGTPAFRKEYKDEIEAMENMTSADRKKADDIISWFEALPDDAKESSYMISLESTLHSDMVTPRSMGLIVSLPAVYFRMHNAATAKATRPVSAWVGSVGTKIPETEVTIVHTGMHESAYGVVQLVKFVDNNGNSMSWWNSSNKTDYEKDQKYKIVGTVKKHDIYRNEKITILTRVKAKEI